MIRIITVVILTLVSTMSLAKTLIRGETFVLSWTPPIAYTDETPLTISELSHYSAKWGCDTGKSGDITIDKTLSSVTIASDDMLGNCDIVMTATTLQDIESADSDSVSVLIKLPKPSYGGFR